ncbi:MAG: hypothetical protein LUG50_15835 [Planctomycetaceae bacterium]|nr:hypothetical protein [Planctomycetaceae bacterium]
MKKLLLVLTLALVALSGYASVGEARETAIGSSEKTIYEGPRRHYRPRRGRRGGGGVVFFHGGGYAPRHYAPRYYVPAPQYYYAPPPVYYAPPAPVYGGGVIIVR